MRDARSSPSATSFLTVDRAHCSFALTCATDSSFETGMFLCSISILRARKTGRILPVTYLIESGVIFDVDRQNGQGWIARLGRQNWLRTLDRGRVMLPVFARCLIPRCPFFCDLAGQRITLPGSDSIEAAFGRLTPRFKCFSLEKLLYVWLPHDFGSC